MNVFRLFTTLIAFMIAMGTTGLQARNANSTERYLTLKAMVSIPSLRNRSYSEQTKGWVDRLRKAKIGDDWSLRISNLNTGEVYVNVAHQPTATSRTPMFNVEQVVKVDRKVDFINFKVEAIEHDLFQDDIEHIATFVIDMRDPKPHSGFVAPVDPNQLKINETGNRSDEEFMTNMLGEKDFLNPEDKAALEALLRQKNVPHIILWKLH